MLKINKNDTVAVISGKDRGKKGKVLRILSKSNRVIVEGVNLVKKHQRKKQQDQQAGVVEVPAAIHLSNLMVVCKNCNKNARVGYKILTDGSKSRICRKCKEPL